MRVCDIMWGGVPSRRSLCLFWRKAQTKGLSLRSPARPEMDEDRKVWEKRIEEQLTKETREGSRQRRAEEDGGIDIAVQGKDGQQKEAVREDSQRWVSIPCGFVDVSRKKHACDNLQMHEKLQKIVTQTSLSYAWNWPKSILFVCSFSPTLSVVFYVAVMKCVIPRRKPLDESLAMNSIGLKKLISRARPLGVVSQVDLGVMVRKGYYQQTRSP